MTINRQGIKDAIMQVAADVFSVKESILNEDIKAGDIEQWDSLGHLRLFMELEHRLQVKFTSAEILNVKSIGEIINIITAKMS